MAIAIGQMKQPLIQKQGGLSDWMEREKVASSGTTSGDVANFRRSTFGDNPANQYRRTFESATAGLGQGPNANPEFLQKTTDDVMDTFIEDHLKTTGQLPTKEQIEEFTGSVITPQFASKAIEMGGISKGAIRSQYVKPYFQMNDIKGAPDTSGEDALQAKYDQIYGGLGDYLTEMSRKKTAQDLTDYNENEAALGRLRSPANIVGANKIREGSNVALQTGLAGLASTRGQGQAGLSEAIARISESGRQANLTSGLESRKIRNAEDESYQGRMLGERQLGLADRIGRMQAEANKPGTLDYINTGLNAANTALKLYGATKGKG